MKYKVTIEFLVDSTDYDPEPQDANEVKEAYFYGYLDIKGETVNVVPA